MLPYDKTLLDHKVKDAQPLFERWTNLPLLQGDVDALALGNPFEPRWLPFFRNKTFPKWIIRNFMTIKDQKKGRAQYAIRSYTYMYITYMRIIPEDFS